MSVHGLISALVVGLVVGALGRLVMPGRQGIPVWLTVAVGTVAALLGTVAARLVGLGATGFGVLDLLVQLGVAGVGMVLVAVTTGRDRSPTG